MIFKLNSDKLECSLPDSATCTALKYCVFVYNSNYELANIGCDNLKLTNAEETFNCSEQGSIIIFFKKKYFKYFAKYLLGCQIINESQIVCCCKENKECLSEISTNITNIQIIDVAQNEDSIENVSFEVKYCFRIDVT